MTSTWRRVGYLVQQGALAGGAAAVGFWVGDVVLLLSWRHTVPLTRWLTGVGAALFVALTSGVVVGGLFSPVVGPTAATGVGRFRIALREHHDDTSHAVASHALTAALLFPLAGRIAYAVALAVPVHVVHPTSIAGVLALSNLAVATALGLMWLPTARLARALVDTAATRRGFRGLTAHVWGVPAVLGVVALAVTGEIVGAHWAEVRALHWQEALPVPTLGLGLAWGIYAALGQWRTARRVLWSLIAVGLAAGTVAVGRIHPESTTARKIAFEQAMSGRVGHELWMAAFDFDRDGYLGFLGDGDCAPFDPRRHPGAIDVPGNGIDEDCDGVDLTLETLPRRPRIAAGQEALPRRPTIVLVTVDGLAAGKLTSIRNGPSLMPNVDSFAARSALFTRAFAQGPATRHSFPSMFTSRWDSEMRWLDTNIPYPLAPVEHQLQDTMGLAGYATAAVVPTEYFLPEIWPSTTRGFQQVDSSAIDVKAQCIQTYPGSVGTEKICNQLKGHNAGRVTDAALRILAASTDQPAYLWVHYYDAHGPFRPLPGLSYAGTSSESIYDAELRYIDHELGRLFAAVDARAEPTYVIFTADHGAVFWRLQGRNVDPYGSDLYTETIHVPLIVHGPGIAARRVDSIASTMDIVPTLTDLLQVGDNGAVEGVSLWPEILQGTADRDRVLFHELYRRERTRLGQDPLVMVSIRDDRWDLILDRQQNTYELYDYVADYHELNDLFEDEGRSSHALRLRSMLGSFLAQKNARGPGSMAAAN